jgi:hypothetical protein
VSKHLITRVIFTLLLAVTGATAIDAQLGDRAVNTSAVVAGLRNTPAKDWIDGGYSKFRGGDMSKDDIVDILIEVPPDTIQSAQ